MDNTTKNKVITAFMGITWYDSYAECRDTKLELFNSSDVVGTDKANEKWLELDATHQWQPEYHTSYDKMIPVMRKLKQRLKEEFGMSMFALDSMHGLDKSLCYEDKSHLFNLLYELICQFNQLTKNQPNGTTDQSQTQ